MTSVENTPSKPTQVVEKKKSWLMWVLEPGIGNGVINFSRMCIIGLLMFLCFSSIFNYSIHYVIMSILALCLGASFEYFVYHLRRSPEIMDPANEKAKID